jgi:ABC-type branched-subunit amino acid transport system substrate-binding protein
VSLSNTSSASFVKQLGIHARGVMVAQVFPSPRGGATALARELQALARDHSLPLTYASIEGFLAAKILVEALRRAGPSASSESLVQALETLRNHDAGGFVVSFGPGQRSGSVFVELSMIDSEGRFMR